MRASGGIAAAVLCLLLPASAQAAEFEVVATSDNDFEPADLTVASGDPVAFRNGGGFHNVRFDDGSFEQPSDPSLTPWGVSRTFTAPGAHRYYCEAHGGPGGAGMAGVIRVPAPGTGPGDTQAPTVTALDLRRARGRRRAVVVVLRASEAGTANVALYRRSRGRFRKVRSVRRVVRAGRTSLKIRRTARGRRLKAGRYRVAVRLTDGAGNRSRRYRAGLRLR